MYERIKAGPCWIVAEIGSNHDGKEGKAWELIGEAARAGADAVKFQSFLADELVRRDSSDYDLLKRLEIPREWYSGLKGHAESYGMTFFSTASNEITLGWLEDIGCELYKIGSPNITHTPLIRAAAETGKPLIISTGLADFWGVDDAVGAVIGTGNRQICLLHCVSQYPAPSGDLNRISELQSDWNWPVGYSDHTLGIGAAVGAVALGARVIEKHFTLDSGDDGPDHHFAAMPAEFSNMIEAIREYEASLVPVERPTNSPMLRSLHAAWAIPAGVTLNAHDVVVIRPDDGLHPRHRDEIIGRKLIRALEAGEPITRDVLRA